MVMRKRTKGKNVSPASSLPSTFNVKVPSSPDLTKYLPSRNIARAGNDKAMVRDNGNGGAPQSSSNVK